MTLQKTIEGAALVAVPAVLVVCALTRIQQTAALSLFVVLVALLMFFASYDKSRPALNQTMPVVVLAALAAAGRVLFFALPDFKPVSAIAIIGGVVFGKRNGFMVGALAALVSNFFMGQGLWTPWQMYAWGLVGYLGGYFAERGFFRKRAVLIGYGFASGLLFGFIMNFWSILGFTQADGALIVLIYSTALPFDLIHSVATVIFLLVLYVPWQRKLDRIKRKYAFGGLAQAHATISLSVIVQQKPTNSQESAGQQRMFQQTFDHIVQALAEGKPAIFPTDTVYGLGVAVNAAKSPQILYELKERDEGKPVAWLIGEVADITRYGKKVPDYALELAQTYFPGGLTLVVQAAEEVPVSFQGKDGTIGLRMPDYPLTLDLIKQVGAPLATTSANISGEPATSCFKDISPQLLKKVEAALQADPAKIAPASTVVDCTGTRPQVLRQGAIVIEGL